MNLSVANRREQEKKNCLGRYSKALRNQNGDNIINPCKSNIHRVRVMENRYIWEGILFMNAC